MGYLVMFSGVALFVIGIASKSAWTVTGGVALLALGGAIAFIPQGS